eukprot:1139726-Pelagomonas_calceolata.AAC.7
MSAFGMTGANMAAFVMVACVGASPQLVQKFIPSRHSTPTYQSPCFRATYRVLTILTRLSTMLPARLAPPKPPAYRGLSHKRAEN